MIAYTANAARTAAARPDAGGAAARPRAASGLAPVASIIDDAAAATGFTRAAILGDRRQAPLMRVRLAVYWAAREATGRSLPSIGRAIGDRDHTTILGGIRRATVLRREDPAFRFLSNLLVAKAAARAVEEDVPCPSKP